MNANVYAEKFNDLNELVSNLAKNNDWFEPGDREVIELRVDAVHATVVRDWTSITLTVVRCCENHQGEKPDPEVKLVVSLLTNACTVKAMDFSDVNFTTAEDFYRTGVDRIELALEVINALVDHLEA